MAENNLKICEFENLKMLRDFDWFTNIQMV